MGNDEGLNKGEWGGTHKKTSEREGAGGSPMTRAEKWLIIGETGGGEGLENVRWVEGK